MGTHKVPSKDSTALAPRPLCIPLDVMEALDETWGPTAFQPHLTASTIEEIWEARGVAKVIEHVMQMYRDYHGEAYVPRWITALTAPDPSRTAAAAEDGRESFGS